MNSVQKKELFDANMFAIKILLNNAQNCADSGQYVSAANHLRYARQLCTDARTKLLGMKKAAPGFHQVIRAFFSFMKPKKTGKVVKMNAKLKPGQL